MTYTLEQFCADTREALTSTPGRAGREKVQKFLEKLVSTNKEFVAEHCGPDAEPGVHLIYHDPDVDFHVLAHINAQGRTSPPHNHGASWALYCQAVEWTDMSEWDRKDDGSVEGYAEVEKRRTYRLEPGHAGLFDVGEIHSIHFPDGGRFIRVTGTDLNKIPTARFDQERNKIIINDPTRSNVAAGGEAVSA